MLNSPDHHLSVGASDLPGSWLKCIFLCPDPRPENPAFLGLVCIQPTLQVTQTLTGVGQRLLEVEQHGAKAGVQW